jgi:lipoprotein-anchoring transpeptidase ErfK/SrfK
MSSRRIKVFSARQVAELWENERLLRTYIISTGKNGLGCVPGSLCTPTGRMRVAAKIGHGLPVGSILKGRVPTGELWPFNQTSEVDFDVDLVLTRILWLEGLEEHNANTRQRYIYLHGTNNEHLLGSPASHGCVRFRNEDIVELFDLVEEGCDVEIG